jgi:hypothetical protein
MYFSEEDIREQQRRDREDEERAQASKPDFIDNSGSMVVCNLCLRPVGPDGANGLCGPCRRGESPEAMGDDFDPEFDSAEATRVAEDKMRKLLP